MRIGVTTRNTLTSFDAGAGERPSVCDFPGCGFSCADQSNMARHRQTHLTSRGYKCTFAGCGYAAKQQCTLKSHVLRKVRTRLLDEG